MSFFDIALLVIIGGFALFGLWFGLVEALGSLVGTILGIYLAARFYQPLADWLINLTGWNANFARVIIFIFAFIIINRLVGLAFYCLNRVLSIITRLPLVSSVNRLLGLLFGVLEGLIALGVIFYFINKFPLGAQFMTALSQSKIAPFCLKLASIFLPLFPPALKLLKDSMRPASF